MPPKKRKSGTFPPSWSACSYCKAVISNKHSAIHKEKSCPPSADNWVHPYIANGILYSTCDILQPNTTSSTNEKSPEDISKEFSNDIVVIPSEVLQLCSIPLGDYVVIKITGCNDSVQIGKQAWLTTKSDPVFGVYLSPESKWHGVLKFISVISEALLFVLIFVNSVADTYNLKPNSQVVISKVEELLPAKLVTVVCESEVGSLNKGKLLSRLQSQSLDKIYCVGNKILLRHYSVKVIFRIVGLKSFLNEDIREGSFCLVTEETKWWLAESEEENNQVQPPKNLIKKLGGLSAVIDDLKDVISLALSGQSTLSGIQISKGVLIYGPPGTGKSTLIAALADHFTNNVIRIDYSKIISKILGETEKELQDLFELAEAMKPSVILIDDLDVLCGKSNSTSEFEKRITATLCLLMDQLNRKPDTSVVVLATTSKLHQVDEMLRCPSRFGKEVDIHVPSSLQRFEILKLLLTDVNHNLDDSDLKSVSDSLHGFVGADMVALVSKAVLKNYKRCQGKENVVFEDFQWALGKVKPSAMKEIMIDIPNVKWEDIGGQEDLKLKLKQCVEWPIKHGEAFTKLGITPPKGVLMFGPPGCSKTMIAKAVATESKLNFISVKGPELFSKWVGESERAVREVFRRARQAAPSIIFFDELDAIGGERNISSGSNVQERVLAQLLTELDGVECLDNVTVIAATNRVDRIDPALIRPGRLDRIIYVPLPDTKTREDIFRLQLKKTCVDEDVVLSELVYKSEGYSGAEVIALCREAALKALEEDLDAEKITRKHFMSAFGNIIPRTPKRLLEIYEKYLLQ